MFDHLLLVLSRHTKERYSDGPNGANRFLKPFSIIVLSDVFGRRTGGLSV